MLSGSYCRYLGQLQVRLSDNCRGRSQSSLEVQVRAQDRLDGRRVCQLRELCCCRGRRGEDDHRSHRHHCLIPRKLEGWLTRVSQQAELWVEELALEWLEDALDWESAGSECV